MKLGLGLTMVAVVCVAVGCSRKEIPPPISVRQAPAVAPGFSENDYQYVAERVVAAIRAKTWPRSFRLALGPVDRSGSRLQVNGARVHEIVASDIAASGVMQVSSRPWIDGQGYGQLTAHPGRIDGVLTGRVVSLDDPATHLSTGHSGEFIWQIVDPRTDRVLMTERVPLEGTRPVPAAAAAPAAPAIADGTAVPADGAASTPAGETAAPAAP